MSNYCSNAIICKDEQSFNMIKSFINDDVLNFEMIVPEPSSNKDILKEILDSSDNTDDYYFEKYSVKDLWRHIYWGSTSNRDVDVKNDKKIIIFETNWNPPYAIVKALWDKGAKFDFMYNDESDDNIYDLHMTTPLKMETDQILDTDKIKLMVDLFGNELWLEPDVE